MATPTELQLIRSRGTNNTGKVSFIELFFDLIFVFAISQLSHTFLEDLSLEGLFRLVLLTMAVWWAWIFTAWVINWLNPETLKVQYLLIALMLLGLVMSTSITKAFESAGIFFAIGYVAFQVGRTAFTVWMFRNGSAELRINWVRILCWLSFSGVFWIAGGIAHESWRIAFWVIALVIDYIGPSLGFWLPRIGRTPTSVWDVEGAYMAERCGLFIIIALGESILVTGANFVKLGWSPLSSAAFAISFISTVALWRIYFIATAKSGHHRIAHSSDPGRVARSGYTYTHLLLVIGIILTAVAGELLLHHPTGHMDMKSALITVGGPVLFLVGNLIFMWIVNRALPIPYLAGIILTAALLLISPWISLILLASLVAVVQLIVSVWAGRNANRA
ncbi:low temperature requirement protein LtrA [Paenibacillus phyllosphaerae]|uniref:Low temperature requirement protein LtrA n=1 Tax=Paenibacillus phyllosphaerae TaxID=274593 RepID=A0A7W5FLA1_9BACL|nr:low temperature requirement protein A [Paenibacillus phyllosphaerae]MBB3108809.1 low temperature requirement protein LtrA [Paenibacillus phyllosphaerae]